MKIHTFRRPRFSSARRFRPVNVAASVMTTMNLYMGVQSVFYSIGLEFRSAALCILMAIIFDMLDGSVARLTKTSSEFGKQLDSLCDLVSFGVAPAVLMFMAYLPEGTHLPLPPTAESIVGKTGSYIGIIYVICTALRLARFNTFQSDRRDSFVGLPSPAAGGTLATFVLFLQYFEARLDTQPLGPLANFMLAPTTILLAILMVSTVLYPKNRFKAMVLKPQHAFITLAGIAFVIAVIHYALTRSVSLVLFPLAMFYILFGILDTGYRKLTGRELKAELSHGSDPEALDDQESDEFEDSEEDSVSVKKTGERR